MNSLSMLNALQNTAAALETMLAHFGPELSDADRYGKEQTLATAKKILAMCCVE